MAEAAPDILNFLKEAERFETADDAVVVAIWAEDAPEVRQSSYLRTAAAAAAEAARQQDLTGQALAMDTVRLTGVHIGLEGHVVTITAPQLGYDAGRAFLVLGSEIDLQGNQTILEGLVQL